MTFTPLAIRSGLLLELNDDRYPTRVLGWDRSRLMLPEGATHYGMTTEGEGLLVDGEDEFRLRPGMFFVVPGRCQVEGGRGLVVSRGGYEGLRQIGGPLEARGRLRYIDGCSDTLLVSPPRRGDPCLNHLHIPPATDQTAHTHPSERVGVILRGRGTCRTPGGVFELKPGMGWRIPAGCLHAFSTADESLDVIAWHPDSDFGPTDEAHPMINRTEVDTR